jgi:hypothetical protein
METVPVASNASVVVRNFSAAFNPPVTPDPTAASQIAFRSMATRYVRVTSGQSQYLHFRELMVFDDTHTNVARGKACYSNAGCLNPSNCCDKAVDHIVEQDNTDINNLCVLGCRQSHAIKCLLPGTLTHFPQSSASNFAPPPRGYHASTTTVGSWVEFDLGGVYNVSNVVIFNRWLSQNLLGTGGSITGGTVGPRLQYAVVSLRNHYNDTLWSYNLSAVGPMYRIAVAVPSATSTSTPSPSPTASASATTSASSSPATNSTPSEPALMLWLRPTDLLTNGEPASCDGSLLPAWRNAAPAAAGRLRSADALDRAVPRRVLDAATGQCHARFDAATGSGLIAASPEMDLSAASASYTIAVVGRFSPRSVTRSGLVFDYRGSCLFILGWWGDSIQDGLHYCGWLGGVTPSAGWSSDRDWRMITFVRDGSRGVASMYINGQLVYSVPFGGGPNGLTLGSSDGDLGEVLVYNGALADADRIQLEGRLARRFRLSHRLPAVHPFFSRAPSIATPAAPPASPLHWRRPEGLPLAGYPVTVWPNVGTGGVACNAVASTARYPTSYGPNGAFRALRYNSSVSSPLATTLTACNGGATLVNYTLVYVGRVWGKGGIVMRGSGSSMIVGFYEPSGSIDAYYQNSWVNTGRPITSVGDWQLYSVVRSAGDVAFFSSGVQLQWQASSPTLTGIEIGQLTYLPDADVAEVVVYNRVLPDAERLSVEAYLAARYNVPGYRANAVVKASASATPLPTASASSSTGASPSPSPTPTPAMFGCSVDEAFSSFTPAGLWAASPAGLVTTTASAAARGIGSAVTDPLGTGSPFVYLLSGAAGNYTTLTLGIDTPDSQADLSFHALFDAGDELPFNAEAAAVISPGDALGGTKVTGAGSFGVTASVNCPLPLLITSIEFASFGNPDAVGSDPQSYAIGSCHAANSRDVVSAACIGRASCSVSSSAAAFAPVTGVCTSPQRLVFVARCSDTLFSQGSTVLFSSDVRGVGAYQQSGWRRVTTTLQPGRYVLTLAVRAVGRFDAGRASALAVDNVRVCLSPPVPPSATTKPLPSLAPLACPSTLSSGRAHTCGISQVSRLVCFGDNSNGQTSVPTELLFAEVSGVAAGGYHTCVIVAGSGAVRCFGGNGNGQCNVPATLSSGASPVRSVAAGWAYTCATLVRGTLVCWGNTPQPPAWASPARSVWVSQQYWLICAEMLGGGIASWGHGFNAYNITNSALTGPTYKYQDTTLTLTSRGDVVASSGVPLFSRAVALSAGMQHYCGMKTGGALVCTGIVPPPQLFTEPCAAAASASFPPLPSGCASFGLSASSPAKSCADAYVSCALTNFDVWVQPAGVAAPYQTYCFQDGWSLALTVLSGAFNSVFEYTSPLWNSTDLLLPASRSQVLTTNVKLQPYVDTPVAEVMLVNFAVDRRLVLSVPSSPSLRDLCHGDSSCPPMLPTRAGWIWRPGTTTSRTVTSKA